MSNIAGRKKYLRQIWYASNQIHIMIIDKSNVNKLPEGSRVPAALKFVGYMFNYGHVIYNM